MDGTKIKENFPSICYDCKNNRRPASDVNTEKGYVGCAEYARRCFKDSPSYSFVTEGEEIAEGWVDLKSYIFTKPSGISTNYQLLTRGIKKCKEFELKED